MVGLESVDIGDTLADIEHPEPLPIIAVDDPTMTMSFMSNDSPGYGQEGKYCTSRQVRDRLFKAAERDVALRVEDTASADTFKISGRGILHLSILIETMRREGYELGVSRPEVIVREIDISSIHDQQRRFVVEVKELRIGVAQGLEIVRLHAPFITDPAFIDTLYQHVDRRLKIDDEIRDRGFHGKPRIDLLVQRQLIFAKIQVREQTIFREHKVRHKTIREKFTLPQRLQLSTALKQKM